MTGSITLAGQSFSYNFSANNGDTVTILMGGNALTGSFEPRVILYAPDGTEVARASGMLSGTIAAQKLNQTGTYFIVCRDAYGAFKGTYGVSLVKIPVIQVTPSSLKFGYVPIGSTKDLTLTVKNKGGGTLTGNATAAAPFSIFAGSSYNLGPNESQIVTVRYQPTSQGPHTGTVVFTGGDGATVQITRKTEKPLGLPWLLLLLGN